MCCIMGYAGHDLPAETFTKYLLRTASRGPDDHRVCRTEFGLLGFGRLAIMGLTEAGMQPFFRGQDCVACNGELYGFRPLKRQLEAEGCTFQSDSDCEILLPLYDRYGLDMFQHLDAEFAMILYDSRKKLLIAARDPIGIRPLFYGYSASGAIAFASEAKNLVGLVKKIYPFPIGSYYCNGQFVRYCDIADTPAYCRDDMDTILRSIREKLTAGVEKRLDADAPVGFLLSGGLDSSLVCAIAAKKLGKPIRTFAIGMDVDAIDLIPEALEFANMGLLPAGMYRNRTFAEPGVDVGAIELCKQDLLYDPQTAGGLLMAVDPADADALYAELQGCVPSAQRIGTVREYRGGKRIFLR